MIVMVVLASVSNIHGLQRGVCWLGDYRTENLHGYVTLYIFWHAPIDNIAKSSMVFSYPGDSGCTKSS